MKKFSRLLLGAWICMVSFACLAAPGPFRSEDAVQVQRDEASGRVLSVTVQDRTFFFEYRDGAFSGMTDSQGNAFTDEELRARVEQLRSELANVQNPRYLVYQNRHRLGAVLPGVLSNRFWLPMPQQQKDFLADNSCMQQCNDIAEANMLICAAIGVIDPPLGLVCMAGAYMGKQLCQRNCPAPAPAPWVGWWNDWGDFIGPSIPNDDDWQYIP